MKKIITILFVSSLVNLNLVMAQKPGVVISKKAGWHKIGEVSASLKMETESIVVLGADKFKAIKLKVTNAPINFLMLKVFYEAGEIEEIPVKSELMPGEETRVMDIKNKDLKKVTFTYKTMPNNTNEKAHIELYGLK